MMPNLTLKYNSFLSKLILVMILFALFTSKIIAQHLVKDSTTIISIEEYQPFLNDAFKIKTNPVINDTDKIIPKLNYQFLSKNINTTFNIDTIIPAKIKGEPLIKLYHGYAKVGFGSNATPLAEIYFSANRSKNFSYGFKGKHLSSAGITGNDYSSYSDEHLSVFGKTINKNFTFYNHFAYDRNVVHYYGFPKENVVIINNKNDIKQRYNKFDFTTSYKRNFVDTNQFNYDATLNYHYIRDLFTIDEHNFNADAKLSKYHNSEIYTMGLDLDYDQLNNSLNLPKSLTIGLNPSISTKGRNEKWEFKFGAGLYVNAEEKTKFHFYPVAEFKYDIADHIVVPYVGIKGKILDNNLSTFYQENPYLNTDLLSIANTNQQYKIYGGIMGNISDKLTFNANINKQKLSELPLYIKDFSNPIENQFIVIYDEANLTVLNFELGYQQLEKLKLLLQSNYFKYDVKEELKAWHKPQYKINLSGIYDLGDKILIKLDLFLMGKQYAKDFIVTTTNNTSTATETALQLKGYFDANLGLEYRYTKKISGFINFNNIGSVRYQRFQDYPTQRFGILGGASISF